MLDMERDAMTRVTLDGGSNDPYWSPDGQRLSFNSSEAGLFNIFSKAVDGSGEVVQLTSYDSDTDSGPWSPDGENLLFIQGGDVGAQSLDGQTLRITATPFNESNPEISPDGRWLAYTSDESNRGEVYVRSFPGPDRRWQASTEGGTNPIWARSGEELFYRNGGKLMAVSVSTEPEMDLGQPRLLFEGDYLPDYDVAPDSRDS
jgi:serine/threonine-protein kinase